MVRITFNTATLPQNHICVARMARHCQLSEISKSLIRNEKDEFVTYSRILFVSAVLVPILLVIVSNKELLAQESFSFSSPDGGLSLKEPALELDLFGNSSILVNAEFKLPQNKKRQSYFRISSPFGEPFKIDATSDVRGTAKVQWKCPLEVGTQIKLKVELSVRYDETAAWNLVGSVSADYFIPSVVSDRSFGLSQQ